MVLLQLQKLKNICVPGLQINGERPFSFSSSLVHIPRCIVEHLQHWNDTVGGSVCPSDVGLLGSDV
jgi:hypothetical protein